MSARVFMPLCNRKTGEPPSIPDNVSVADVGPPVFVHSDGIVMMRFDFDHGDNDREEPPQPSPAGSTDAVAGKTDLDLIEGLLERCWREVDAADLNVKMTDIVRLLEFKYKLRPAAEAEQAFWSMIDQMRRDELVHCGEPPVPGGIPAGERGEAVSATHD